MRRVLRAVFTSVLVTIPSSLLGQNVTVPTTLDFGRVLVGNSNFPATGSQSASLVVSDAGGGGGTGAISSPGAPASGPGSFAGGPLNYGPLGVGGTATQAFTFTPSATGTSTASVSVSNTAGLVNGAASPGSVTLSGVGVAPLAAAATNTVPGPGNNGAVLVGSSFTGFAILANNGNGNTNTQGITGAQGANLFGSASFTFSASLNPGDVTGPGGQFGGANGLGDGAGGTLNFTFSPTQRQSGTVTIGVTTLNGGPGSNVAVAGAVTQNLLGVAPVSNLGSVAGPTNAGGNPGTVLVGMASQGTVQIQNLGDGSLAGPAGNLRGTIQASQANGGTAGGTFSRVGGGGINLANSTGNGTTAGNVTTQNFTYNYTAAQVGTVSATLNANFTNGNPAGGGNNTAHSVPFSFSGNAVAPVLDTAAGNNLNANFGNVRIGTTSASQSVTISNIGNGNTSGVAGSGVLGAPGGGSNLNGSVAATPGQFNMTGGAAGGFSLADNTSTSVAYSFSPLTHENNNPTVASTLNGSSNLQNQAVGSAATLAGRGVGPEFAVNGALPSGPLDNSARTSTVQVASLDLILDVAPEGTRKFPNPAEVLAISNVDARIATIEASAVTSDRVSIIISNLTPDPDLGALTDLTVDPQFLRGDIDRVGNNEAYFTIVDILFHDNGGAGVRESNSGATYLLEKGTGDFLEIVVVYTADLRDGLGTFTTNSLRFLTDQFAPGGLGDLLNGIRQIVRLQAVNNPEPASILLWGTVGLGAAVHGWRKRRRHPA